MRPIPLSPTQAAFEAQAAEVFTYVNEAAAGTFDGPPEAQTEWLDRVFNEGPKRWRNVRFHARIGTGRGAFIAAGYAVVLLRRASGA